MNPLELANRIALQETGGNYRRRQCKAILTVLLILLALLGVFLWAMFRA